MTTTSQPNGTAEVSDASQTDAFGDQIASLRAVLAQEQAQYEELKSQADAAYERVSRVRKALTALGDESVAPKAPKTKSRSRNQAGWTPSDPIIDEVFDLIAGADGPIDLTTLIEKSPRSRTTIRAAIDELRTRERIRLAGTDGLRKLYAPMGGS